MKRISIFGLIITFGISYSLIGKYSRDEIKIKDIRIISKNIPDGTILYTTLEYSDDWALIAYLSRIGNLSLDNKNKHEYILLKKNENIHPDIANEYQIMNLELTNHRIYRKKTP